MDSRLLCLRMWPTTYKVGSGLALYRVFCPVLPTHSPPHTRTCTPPPHTHVHAKTHLPPDTRIRVLQTQPHTRTHTHACAQAKHKAWRARNRLIQRVPWGLQGMQGTFPYMAPEVLIDGRASPSSDIFSFGVILWYGLHRLPVYRR